MPPSKKAVTNRSATIKWENQYPDQKNPKTKTKILDVRIFPEGIIPGNVTYGRGETVSIAQYETTKVFVSVTMPCLKEELVYAMKYVTSVVENELVKSLKEIEETYLKNG